MKTKSYDISMDTFVNVTVPADYDPDNDGDFSEIMNIATKKFMERLRDREWTPGWPLEEYYDHDPSDPPDTGRKASRRRNRR